METSARLQAQLSFLTEIDKLKMIQRRNYLMDGSRIENTAEHSWHIAVLAGILQEHSNEAVNLEHVLLMLLMHDIVEIEAGDTYAYDETGNQDKEAREHAAADHLFGMLPPDQCKLFKTLWLEFEDMQTPESRFANTVDRVLPLFQNFNSGGKVWVKNKIKKSQVLKRMQPIKDGSEALWQASLQIMNQAIQNGYIVDDL